MEPDKIKKDENNGAEMPRVPSKNQEQHDNPDLKDNPETESLQQKSERDRNQGNETIGIP